MYNNIKILIFTNFHTNNHINTRHYKTHASTATMPSEEQKNDSDETANDMKTKKRKIEGDDGDDNSDWQETTDGGKDDTMAENERYLDLSAKKRLTVRTI